MRKTTAGEYFSPRDFQRGREWWLNVVMGEQDHLYVRTTKRLAQRVPPQSPNSERTRYESRVESPVRISARFFDIVEVRQPALPFATARLLFPCSNQWFPRLPYCAPHPPWIFVGLMLGDGTVTSSQAVASPPFSFVVGRVSLGSLL